MNERSVPQKVEFSDNETSHKTQLGLYLFLHTRRRRNVLRAADSIGNQLHWLPIEWRVKFKIACITYKTISTNEPAYLHSLLKHYVPSRSLRSSDSNLLSVPRVCTCFGSRSFAVAAPTI